jgi:hypothetical protein
MDDVSDRARKRMKRRELLQDPSNRSLLEDVQGAFRKAWEEELGRELTPEEERRLSTGIQIDGVGDDPDEYEFDRVSELVASGVPLEEAERQAREDRERVFGA